MEIPEEYVGREQTYIKHLFFSDYLEKVAYRILKFKNEFVYVDGFCGPWGTQSNNYKDSSFYIALSKLKEVRDGAEKAFNKHIKIRCLFIEKEKGSVKKLQEIVPEFSDERTEIEIIHGEFEDQISTVRQFINNSFSLIFIDPTGWKGYALNKIKPLLSLRGEIIINFMFDYINRFINYADPKNTSRFNELLGYESWSVDLGSLNEKYDNRERSILELYRQRLKQNSGKFVTYTPIIHPTKDRSYFYLIYLTSHPVGLREFHNAEHASMEKYGYIRRTAKHDKEVQKTNQPNLFGSELDDASIKPVLTKRGVFHSEGEELLHNTLATKKSILYEDIMGTVLETPLITERELKGWLSDLKKEQRIRYKGLKPNQRTPRPLLNGLEAVNL